MSSNLSSPQLTIKTVHRGIKPLIWLLLAGTLLLAFALRATYMFRFVFHGDEFYTLLAIKQVLEKGVPVLPSGIIYEKGLAYTYLAAGLSGVAGWSEAVARWPSVIAGILAIVAIFTVGRKLFDSPLAGLIAAVALAFDEETIAWSTRARMYTLAQLTVIFLLGATCQLATTPRQRYLLLTLGLIACALLAHAGTLVLLPIITLAILLTLWREKKLTQAGKLFNRWNILLLVLVLSLGLLLIFGGTAAKLPLSAVPEGTNFNEDAAESVQPNHNIAGIPFQNDSYTPEALRRILEKYTEFLTTKWRITFTLLALGVGGWVLYHFALTRSVEAAYRTVFLLTILACLTFLPLLLVPSIEFRQNRNLLLLLIPQVYLLSGAAVSGLAQVISRKGISPAVIVILSLIASIGLFSLGFPVLRFLQPGEGKVRYDQAYAFVQTHRQSDDIIISPRPELCYLYLRRCDYFIGDKNMRGTKQITGYNTDWYVGVPWIDNQVEFNRILSNKTQAWLVIQGIKFTSYFSGDLIQQILAQMELAQRVNDILIFRSNLSPLPLPLTPDYSVDYRWKGDVHLVGYTANSLNSNQLALTLFWQNVPLAAIADFKIFVHVRAPDGRTLFQADHMFLEGIPYDLQAAIGENSTALRDRVVIDLPLTVNLKRDRFIIGIYQKETGQRWPLLNDQSGENGVWLDKIP